MPSKKKGVCFKKKKTTDIQFVSYVFFKSPMTLFPSFSTRSYITFFYNALDFHGRSGPVDLQNFKKLSTPSCTVSCWNKCESLSLLSLEMCFYDRTARDYHLF